MHEAASMHWCSLILHGLDSGGHVSSHDQLVSVLHRIVECLWVRDVTNHSVLFT